MDRREAIDILAHELAKYRTHSYEQLRAIVDAPKRTFEVVGPSGTRYYVDVRIIWDEKPQGDVRVIGCIDDGGWRGFLPLTDSFIKEADGAAEN